MCVNKCDCPVCNGYGIESPEEIVNQHMLQLKNAEQDDHALEILASLFNKGYLLGFKTAVAERIESDIATLEFMKGNK